ncbi:MAG: NAD(P)/FAD-dependent oxidoreductase [Alphaproteobacteria bacterium]|nr:NAD(P)/FAD-dependent oxidoreductase [Alphaproteobacteria bacterium]
MQTYNTDILIVGAGPVGIFSVYQAGFLGMKTIVVDALAEIGGQPIALYPNKYIYDIPAYPKIQAADLIEKLIQQATPFMKDGSGVFLLNSQVLELSRGEDKQFCVKTSMGDTIYAKAIVICAGAGAFGPNRPPLENIENFEGQSVHYFVKNPEIFRDKNIVIAGGGDSAVDWAIELSNIAKKIYMVHRRDSFRAAPASVEQLKKLADESKIDMVIPFMLDGLKGDGKILKSVILKDLDDNKKEIEADHLLAFFGLSRSLGELENWGFKINKLHSSIEVNLPTCETAIDGIFAVGDVAQYEHKLKLISTGFAESSMALHAAWKYVFPDKPFHFVHSTSK